MSATHSGARVVAEAFNTAGAVAGFPSFESAQAYAGVTGEGGEGYLVFDVQSEDPPTLDRVHQVYTAGRGRRGVVGAGCLFNTR
jgi:hypothetical protein